MATLASVKALFEALLSSVRKVILGILKFLLTLLLLLKGRHTPGD